MAKGYTSEIYETARRQAFGSSRPGVTYIAPGIISSGAAASGPSPSDKETAQKVLDDLRSDPERALIDAKHPNHADAVYAFRKAHEVLYDSPLVVERPEVEQQPYMSRLVRETASQPTHDRVNDARQALAEIFDDKKWAGPDGKGRHPLFDGSSPRHQSAVEEYKQLFEMAHPELKEKA